jgi:hypothetical protein
MNESKCSSCKKICNRDALTEMYGWGEYLCTPCVEECLNGKKSQWVRVGDKMPPKDIYVMVYSPGAPGGCIAFYRYAEANSISGNPEGWESPAEVGFNLSMSWTFWPHEITHWTPLPAFPSEGK